MMKKILPFTIIATSILTTIPVVTACKQTTDDTDFKPVLITWNYRQGEYVYPITPLSEQTVDSKEALTKLYLNDVYENPEILANDIILSYYLEAFQQYIEEKVIQSGKIDVYISDVDLENQTISYNVNIFLQCEIVETFTQIGQFSAKKIPCIILPVDGDNKKYDLTVPSLEPNFWSNNQDWEVEMWARSLSDEMYYHFNYDNCLDETEEELDNNLQSYLLGSFGASDVQYLKNITIS